MATFSLQYFDNFRKVDVVNPDFLSQNGSFSEQLLSALGTFAYLMAEISLLFLLISSLVGVINQKLPKERIQALLGGQRGRGYLMAAGLGGLTPFCSCSTIPMLIGLLKARAGFGPTMTFLITSPLLNPLVIALFLPVFGAKVTLVYALLALTVAILGGRVLQALGFERYIKAELLTESAAPTRCCDRDTAPSSAMRPLAPVNATSCCATAPVKPVFQRITPVVAEGRCGALPSTPATTTLDWRRAAREGVALYRKMLPYMALAMAIGALVHGFVPSDFFAAVAGADNPWAIPLAAVIGIPLYIRVEALLPLVGSLVGKGVSLGAVMALTIGSGGASIPELIMLKRLFRWPLLLAFVLTILLMAIGGGWVFNRLG